MLRSPRVGDLYDDIESGDFDPIYVLASEHPILIDRALAGMRDAVVPAGARGFNYDVVEGPIKTAAAASRVVALAQTLPMMAQRRLVYVRELGAPAGDEAEQLLAYVAKPNPSTVIVAVTQKLDKRLKLYSTLSKKGFVHVLEAPKPQALAGWVRQEAMDLGVALAPEAVNRLVDAVGGDISRLALTIEQLGLYAGKRGVTSDDVDDLIADTRERSVFELQDAIGAADRKRALVAVHSLCDQRESAVGVVVMVARYVRQMALVHALREAGTPRFQWASKLGCPPFVVDKIAAQARQYSTTALARATQRLAMADRALKGDQTLIDTLFTGPQMKTFGRDLGERVILEQVVDGIVQLAG
jgi:DNA polymerase III subunit delta